VIPPRIIHSLEASLDLRDTSVAVENPAVPPLENQIAGLLAVFVIMATVLGVLWLAGPTS
jgi:hypothetical protein